MNICPSCQGVNLLAYQFCQFCGSKISVDIANATLPQSLDQPKEEVELVPNELDEDFEHDDEPYDQLNQLASSQLSEVETSPSTCLRNIEYAGKTDVGVQRDRNEDDFAAVFQTRSISGGNHINDRSDRGLFVLCDGMGGHEGGEIASTAVVNSIIEQFRPFWIDSLPGQQKINDIICQANQEIFTRNESEQRESLGRMGTTLVVLAIHDSNAVIAHVGDSRIYKVSSSSDAEPLLTQLTRDHEVLNQLLDLGLDLEIALTRPDVHQLTQAIGPHSSHQIDPAISYFAIAEPSLFLLCSDGLSDNDVIEDNWRSHLLPILNREIDLSTGLDNLIELGNNLNGHDNLTAVLVLCD